MSIEEKMSYPVEWPPLSDPISSLPEGEIDLLWIKFNKSNFNLNLLREVSAQPGAQHSC